MRSNFLFKGLGTLLFAGAAAAAPSISPEELGSKAELVPRASTCNTPSNRACWTTSPPFNINTDYETAIPDTGKTRPYHFTITEKDNWVAGDGSIKRVAMLINDQFPGPVISADWGDWIEVTVTNNLRYNGTSIHWHGVRMQNNNINDGANGVTECPIPPGHSKVYRFRAQQYGTSWYHSHFSAQYGNGVTGSIVIRGPASLPYDIDLGPFPITDWYHEEAEHIQRTLIPVPGAAPPSDNVLFNGTHVGPNGGGAYARVKLTPGKRHLLRLINPSVDNTFTVSLVGHQFTVIGTDFVPVNAYTTSSIYMGVGQRYDVTIDASQPIGNYWFNVTFSQAPCGTSNAPFPAAIFTYEGANESALPTNKGTPPVDSFCADNLNFTPVIQRSAPQSQFSVSPANNLSVAIEVKQWEGVQRVYWKVDPKTNMNITWDEPTLEYVKKGNLSFPDRYNLFTIPQSNVWSFWVVENVSPVPHPMHLHGHDFLVLGQADPYPSPFTPGLPMRHFNPAQDIAKLKFNNPTRRDVTMLPALGWTVVAFKTDNPGAWLFHCHIAWHVSQGLSVQYLERVQDIPGAMDLNAITPNCDAWTSYYATAPYKQIDSGL